METTWTPMTESQFLESIADLPPAPRCELCGTDERIHDDHGVILCIPCAAECQVTEYPQVVAFVGSVVARAAQAVRQ